ncbi:Gag protease polyprotein-like protein [Gossypium australe]|uniref:Gag protease polyprotein-like protein n=1 Tax=Gossypium australe TaxID=47621 RepID=A0A5B6VXY2_9ROSI|nr:Gag protease polyprotein-like protein [Gossypium australe]
MNNKLPVESPEFVVKVTNSLGQYVFVENFCRKCPLKVQDWDFLADLMLLPFDNFDVIRGIDWLILHDAVNGVSVSVESKNRNSAINVISALTAQKFVWKGCEAYLVYMLDTKALESKLDSVPIVSGFAYVFPEKLPRLPPVKEIKFAIDLVSGTSPIPITPIE